MKKRIYIIDDFFPQLVSNVISIQGYKEEVLSTNYDNKNN